MIPVSNSYRLAENLPNAVLLAYPDSGHGSSEEILTPHGIDIVAPDVQPDRTLVLAGCDPLVGVLVQATVCESSRCYA